MDSDKISKQLEKQLKILGSKSRIEILKKLNISEAPLPFSVLQKEVYGINPNSANISFHLKSLREIDYIDLTDAGYFITNLGKRILKNILSMEQVLNDQNKAIMIRTSKYSKEPFNIQKVIDFLIKEGGMEAFLARKIAREVEERLSRAHIEYLTTPLIREYINAILLENGLEDIRHKLTRLGVPPYEVSKLFHNPELNPDYFLIKLGSEVSEQYLLLNLLPRNLADMYLTGEIALLHLNTWSLKPIGLYINCETINQNINIHKSKDFVEVILDFMDYMNKIAPFFSQDILIGNFNKNFLSIFKDLSNEEIGRYFKILNHQFIKFNNGFNDKSSHLSLDFSYIQNEELYMGESAQFQLDRLFLNHLNTINTREEIPLKPLIFFDYSKIISSDLRDLDLVPLMTQNNFIFYNNKSTDVMNSIYIKINRAKEALAGRAKDRIILDKILINLHLIALQAKQDDNRYLELLEEKLKAVFSFFKYKQKLIKKNISSLNTWDLLRSDSFNGIKENWVQDSIKSISFFGLNEAIISHCGIELDRVEKSESFAIKIISVLGDLIKEQNQKDNNNYLLTQPHDGAYLKNGYSSRIIRSDSKLSFNKKILLFKKFEKIINGGTLFNSEETILDDKMSLLINSGINAFSLSN